MIKKILVGLGHPAHVHLFRNTIEALEQKGIEVIVVISDKDILVRLVEHYKIKYTLIANKDKKQSLYLKLLKQIRSTNLLNRIIRKEKPDLLIGCLSQLAFSGFLMRKPVLFFGEDDFKVTFLQGLVVYPFVKRIIAPEVTNVGPFKWKKISYNGYQKLAYLHPFYFQPDREKVVIPRTRKFFLLRLSKLNAYHDTNASGITDELALSIIDLLKSRGDVLISSERELPDSLKAFEFTGNLFDMHHYMAFAELLICDSQTMTVEAALLGTPNIRFNNFVGKLSVLNDLEQKYNITSGILPSDTVGLFKKIDQILNDPQAKDNYKLLKNKMISGKINVTDFFIWLIENYPSSIESDFRSQYFKQTN